MNNNNKDFQKVPNTVFSSVSFYSRLFYLVIALLLMIGVIALFFYSLVYSFSKTSSIADIFFVLLALLTLLMAIGFCFLLCQSLFRCWKRGYLDWGNTRYFPSQTKGTKTEILQLQTKEL